MEKQNITLSLPKDLLMKVKHIAIDQNTSVSGLLAASLAEIAKRDEAYNKSKRHYLKTLDSAMDFKTNGFTSWTRNDLHER